MKLLSKLDPHHKMYYVFHVLIRKPVAFIGHDFFEVDEFKPYFLTYAMYMIMCWFWIGAYYTMTHYDLIVQLHMISLTALAFEVRKYNFNIMFTLLRTSLVTAENLPVSPYSRIIRFHKICFPGLKNVA